MKVKEMSSKRIALALLIASLAVPAGAGAQQTLVPYQHSPGIGVTPSGTPDPVARIIAQERGRALDQRLFSTPATIEIVESGGFHWGDAGIGAGTAAGLLLLALGTTLVVRSTRVRSA